MSSPARRGSEGQDRVALSQLYNCPKEMRLCRPIQRAARATVTSGRKSGSGVSALLPIPGGKTGRRAELFDKLLGQVADIWPIQSISTNYLT
jgi:hypothetical protein